MSKSNRAIFALAMLCGCNTSSLVEFTGTAHGGPQDSALHAPRVGLTLLSSDERAASNGTFGLSLGVAYGHDTEGRPATLLYVGLPRVYLNRDQEMGHTMFQVGPSLNSMVYDGEDGVFALGLTIAYGGGFPLGQDGAGLGFIVRFEPGLDLIAGTFIVGYSLGLLILMP